MNTFTLLLVLLTCVTGMAYLIDISVYRRKRVAAWEEALRANPGLTARERRRMLEPRGLLGQCASLFPIVLCVFLFRAFIIEPFRIPSDSMMPTLLDGDFIAVTKWSYGIKNPLNNETLMATDEVRRGDIIVFKYPEDPSLDYIKRVVGLPGDEIMYKNKTIYLRQACAAGGMACDHFVEISTLPQGTRLITSHGGAKETYRVFEEALGSVHHQIMINPLAPEYSQYFHRQQDQRLGTWRVPEDHYFVMGDNRDNSKDSRFWGFVPRQAIVGKTVGIWLSLGSPEPGSGWPSFLPVIRFERLGAVR